MHPQIQLPICQAIATDGMMALPRPYGMCKVVPSFQMTLMPVSPGAPGNIGPLQQVEPEPR